MLTPGESRSALDQASSVSAPGRAHDDGLNGVGPTTLLAPAVTARHGPSLADGREIAAERGRPLLLVAAAMAAGIVADRYFPLSAGVWFAVAAAALVTWLILTLRAARYVAAASVSPNAISALLVAVAATGGMWHHLHWRLFAAEEIGRYAREPGQPVCLEVVALSAPRLRPAPPPDPLRSIQQDASTVLRVRAMSLRDGGVWRPVEGRATMTVAGTFSGVDAGDRLRVFGQLQASAPPGNPGEFDFAWHRRGDRDLAAIRVDNPESLQVVEPAPWYSLRRALGKLRSAGDRLLWGTLSHERAGLAAAVLLGAREQLDDEMKDQFLVTGTVHILSISGLHVGILAWLLFKAFRTGWMPRGPALFAVALVTLMYTLVTDAEPPAVRATVLVWAICGAVYLGRPRFGANALALAAICVLAINPADLFRTGAQLSFLSVATLIALASWWQKREPADALTRLIRATRPLPVRAAGRVGSEVGVLAMGGVMIWLVTTPIVAHQFHVVSLSALVLNIVLWIPVLVAMIAGFAILAFGWLLPPLATVLGVICDFNLAAIESAIEAAAQTPGNHFWLAGPAPAWLYVFYGLLALPFLVPQWICHRRILAATCLWVVIGFAYAGLSKFEFGEPELACGFLSVGHGSAVVLELPDGQVWLYDAGRVGSPRAGARSVEAYLRSRRISRIDAVILSHADIDHYNALPELLKKFSVQAIYVSPQMFREDSPPLAELRKAVSESGVPMVTLADGDALVAGDCRARVLHPPTQGVAGNDNAQSIVLCVQFGERRVLLTGDLQGEGMRRLLAAPPLDCDILLAPHHGSSTSDPAAVVNWSTPEWAVISCGQAAAQAGNEYQPLLGPRAISTAEAGAVRARLSGERVEVRAWRIDPWN